MPRTWIVEFLNADGSSNRTETVLDAATTVFTFMDLDKGTVYRARVAGTNVRGTGAVSPTATVQTTVDRKYMCVGNGIYIAVLGETIVCMLQYRCT